MSAVQNPTQDASGDDALQNLLINKYLKGLETVAGTGDNPGTPAANPTPAQNPPPATPTVTNPPPAEKKESTSNPTDIPPEVARKIEALEKQNEEYRKLVQDSEKHVLTLQASVNTMAAEPFVQKMLTARAERGMPKAELEVFVKSLYGVPAEQVEAMYNNERMLYASAPTGPFGQQAQAPNIQNPNNFPLKIHAPAWNLNMPGAQPAPAQAPPAPFNGAPPAGNNMLQASAPPAGSGESKTLEEMLA